MTKPSYQISFSNADNVSAWGGLALWAQFLKALRFRSQLARWSLPTLNPIAATIPVCLSNNLSPTFFVVPIDSVT